MTKRLYYSGPLVGSVVETPGPCGSNPYGLAKLDAGVEPEDVLRGLLKYCFGPYRTKKKAYDVARYQGATAAILEFSLDK